MKSKAFRKTISITIALLVSFGANANMMSESENQTAKNQALKSQICGKKTCKNAFKKLREYAGNGNAKAQAIVALLYITGTGTEVNKDVGVGYMRKAALQGLAFAQFELGVFYILGEHVEKDEAKGTEFIKRAAAAGFRPAIATLNNSGGNAPSSESESAPENDDERVLVTSNLPTLSDLIEYLRLEGAASEGQTGSRLPGRGCENSSMACISYTINSGQGIKDWNVFLQQYGSVLARL